MQSCIADMREEERQAASAREQRRTTVPPVSSIPKRDPRSRPSLPKRTRKRKSASGTEEQIKRFREAYQQMLPVYRAASLRYRQTGTLVPLPAGTYPPRITYPLEET